MLITHIKGNKFTILMLKSRGIIIENKKTIAKVSIHFINSAINFRSILKIVYNLIQYLAYTQHLNIITGLY